MKPVSAREAADCVAFFHDGQICKLGQRAQVIADPCEDRPALDNPEPAAPPLRAT